MANSEVTFRRINVASLITSRALIRINRLRNTSFTKIKRLHLKSSNQHQYIEKHFIYKNQTFSSNVYTSFGSKNLATSCFQLVSPILTDASWLGTNLPINKCRATDLQIKCSLIPMIYLLPTYMIQVYEWCIDTQNFTMVPPKCLT